MTPQEFATKWGDSRLKERAGAQRHWASRRRQGTRV